MIGKHFQKKYMKTIKNNKLPKLNHQSLTNYLR